MKIAFDAKRAFHNLTGLGNYSRSVIHSISEIEANNQIYLFTPTVNRENFDISKKNIKIIKPKGLVNKSYWRFIGLKKELINYKIDIYHGLSNEIPCQIKTRSIVTIHDLLFLKYPKFYQYIDRKIYYLKSKLACQNADQIIATSQETKKDIINFFNIKSNKIHVVYQSCHPAFINPTKNEISNQKTDLILKHPFILYVGSIEKRKNLIFLLSAIKKMNKEIKLICIGKKTHYYQKVSKFISENNLRNQVSFLNIHDAETLSLLYRKSRGLVYPSINEGFGIPIIEAMYSKIPVITSNAPIFKEVGGKHSYYFEEGKLDSLIQGISEIWTDSKEREEKIKINFEYVQRFNEHKQAKEILDLYKTIM